MKNSEVVEYVYKLLYSTKEPLTDDRVTLAAQQLVNHAINNKESPDNVTAVIVVFQHPSNK